MNTHNFPISGCVVVLYEGKILGVSRKHDTSQWGIPGGKAEEGETPAMAAARECWEETGLIVEGLRHIYEGDCGPGSDGKSFYVHSYLVDKFHGSPKQMGEGKVGWITEQELLSGPFADYNSRLLTALKKYRAGLDSATDKV